MSGRLPIDVMISSTSVDLPEHREQATDAVLRCRMYPWAMETLAPTTGDALSVSLKMVDKSEIYVGIIGMRYGYVPVDAKRNPDQLSITELEYRRALERGIPILIYIMHADHPAPERKAGDKDTFFEASPEGVKKLELLKAEMSKNHIVGFFKSPTELRALVIQSLNDVEVLEVALTKAGELDPPPVPPADDIGIPLAPALYSVPPYTLTNNFIGRAAELAMLDEWVKSKDSLLVIDAIGGMGKSALTWEWTQRVVNGEHDFAGVFWYSFYEGGAQMGDFMRHALAYVTQQKPDEMKKLSYDEVALQLLIELSQGRYLFVMDGLERVLVAYHRLDASQVRDDQVKNDLRDCISHKDTLLLQKLAAMSRSKILISTRLMPRALEDAGTPIRGVEHRHLKGLHSYDALNLMKDRGVTWDNEQALDKFMAQIGYHGLLLKVIAGRIKTHRRARGHFDTWYEQDGRGLDLYKLTDDHRRTHVLKYAFEGIQEDKRRLLGQIGVFSDAVDYETISIFNPYIRRAPEVISKPRTSTLDFLKMELRSTKDDKRRAELESDLQAAQANINSQQAAYETYLKTQADYEAYLKSDDYRAGLATFDTALTELEDRGLLQWNRENDSYELHPVVRGYSFDQLQNRVEAFDRIHDHFQNKPRENYKEAQTLADLRGSLEIYRALVGANRFDDAARFYRGAFAQALHFNISNYHKIIELLTPLFLDEHLDQPLLIAGDGDRGFILNNLAYTLRELGRTRDALERFAQVIHLRLNNGDIRNLIINIDGYNACLRDTNRLADSVHGYQLAEYLATASGNDQDIATNKIHLMGIYILCGRWAEAQDAYAVFRKGVLPPRAIYRPGGIERSFARLQFFQGENPRALLEQGLQLAMRDRAFAVQMSSYALGAREPYSNWYELKRAREMLKQLGMDEPKLPPFNPTKVTKIPYEDEIRDFIEELKTKPHPTFPSQPPLKPPPMPPTDENDDDDLFDFLDEEEEE
jgi:hypothetical protein